MKEKDLKKNMEFVEKNREALLKEHLDKYLLVFEEKLVASYDTYELAANEGVRLFGMDANFLVYHLVAQEPLNFIMEAML